MEEKTHICFVKDGCWTIWKTYDMQDFQRMISELVNADWGSVWSTLKTETVRTLGDFYSGVDWSEKWIRAVLFILAVWCVMIVVYRQDSLQIHLFTTSDCYRFQLTAFLVNSAIVFGAKALNSLGQQILSQFMIYRQYWAYFATKNYFDENGFFISFFISIPMLLITAIQIVYYWRRISRCSFSFFLVLFGCTAKFNTSVCWKKSICDLQK